MVRRASSGLRGGGAGLLDIRCVKASDFAETVEAYMTDLRERNRAWGTIASYVHALY